MQELKVRLVLANNEFNPYVTHKENEIGYPIIFVDEDFVRVLTFAKELAYDGFEKDLELIDFEVIMRDKMLHTKEQREAISRLENCLFFYWKNDDQTFETYDNREVTITQE